MKSKTKTAQPCHTYLSLQVVDFTIHINAGISHKAIELGSQLQIVRFIALKATSKLLANASTQMSEQTAFTRSIFTEKT